MRFQELGTYKGYNLALNHTVGVLIAYTVDRFGLSITVHYEQKRDPWQSVSENLKSLKKQIN